MNYEQFILSLLACVKDKLDETVIVEKQEILKNNGVIATGITIRNKEEKAAPIIYLEDYFKKYCMGETIEDLTEHLLECRNRVPEIPTWNYGDILDFEKIRHLVVYKLVNAEKNKQLLTEVPNLPMLDFAILFYLMIPVNEYESCSILIRNLHMNYWKLPISVLYQCAKENTEKRCPYILKPLTQFVSHYLQGEVPESPLLVLTNESGVNGAAVILYPGIPKIIFEYIGKNYYILPSSIHELLIVPDDIEADPLNLQEIVRDVNENHIEAEEFLSDSVYYFNGENITKM